MLNCKGAAGLKPCLLCANVFSGREVRSIVESDKSGVAVYHFDPDHSKLQPATPEFIDAVMNRLRTAHGTLSNDDFDELETRLGWNYNPHGVMQDARWRARVSPLLTVLWDWMHVFFVSGVFNVHVGIMMKRIKRHRVTYALVGKYAAAFRFPKRLHGAKPCDVFNERRSTKHYEESSFKCTASDGLCCMRIFHWLSPTAGRAAARRCGAEVPLPPLL